MAAAGYARASRCHEEDIAALQHAIERLSSVVPDGVGFAYNVILNRHILYRELYRFDVDVGERSAAQADLLATRRGDVATAMQAAAFGPSWRVPGEVATPDTETKLVLLSGALDPLDPPSWAQRTSQRWPQADLISVPWAGHSVLRYLGLAVGQCGEQLLSTFFKDQDLPVDCVESSGPSFSGDSLEVRSAAQNWFGGALF
ncbi:MAG: alpha/beta hydrolase [Cyanobacteria bacterium P01_A01_bin.137]